MKVLLNFVLVCAMIFSACSLAVADEKTEQQAVTAAEKWLTVVDAGEYKKSWRLASELFKAAINAEQWSNSVATARKPFGPVISRNVKVKQYATTLPGAPDGEYVVIQFQSSFQNKKSAIETVTPKRDADGTWRVSGYYIR